MFERRTGLIVGLLLVACAPAAAQDIRTLTSLRQRQGEERLEVDVEYGAGRLSLEPAARGLLYRATMRYDANAFRPVIEYRSGHLELGMKGSRNLRGKHRASRLQLALGPDVPLDLSISFGAGQADLELGGLRLREADISTGASETSLRFSRPNAERGRSLRLHVGAAEFHAYQLGNANFERVEFEGGVGDILLDFTGDWRGDMAANIDMGLGALTLRLPHGLGVRVTKDTFLSSFTAHGLVKRGESYYSENWDSARHRLTINIDAALGSIDITWVAGDGAV
ncbi:MAG: hypothetical protein HY561_09515 [Gemmatimonadetes bacterium]|nr:hypothetical protein [Gemmatimonadota bacterium]